MDVLFVILCVFASGISTGFSEIKLENLQIGKSYSTNKDAGLPLEIVNTGENPIDLKIELLTAGPSELKEGFEPVPDLAWIKLEKDEFKNIKPKNSAVTDVVISIPNDEKYRGKKYQVYIWSHTVGTSVGVGLKSRLLLNMDKDKHNKAGKLE